MAKGRRRKPGPRTKSGRLSRAGQKPVVDKPTPQLQARRQALVGEGNDPALSATAIGSLLATGVIDADQYNAALRYRALRCALFGPPWPSNVSGSEADQKRLQGLMREFKSIVGFWVPLGSWHPGQEPDATFRKGRLTREQIMVVENVCVFDCRPNWWFAERLNLKQLPEDHVERELLLTGLDALLERGRGMAA
jgi:hypothetical protein